MITGHGDDAYLFDTNIIANFSSNVYYKGFPEGLKAHLILAIDKINSYPEANADSLRHCLATYHHLSIDQLLITNGATEAFYLIAQSLHNKNVTIVIPSFAEYEDACHAAGLSLQFLDWDQLNATTPFTTDVAFLGNPNNPTGSILKKEVLQSILKLNTPTTFVIDEAYVDFTEEDISMIPKLDEFSNLIIVRSLTKAYSIPGLRLGYIISNSTIIGSILTRKMPWSVNTMAIAAGQYIINNQVNLLLPLKQLLDDTQQLIQQLSENEYVKIIPTRTNFFLCETTKGIAAVLKSFLVNEYGILIRDASNFKGLSKRHFRIATQTPAQNELLVKAISQWTINN
jgi:threonine-phosphate decarboxylase